MCKTPLIINKKEQIKELDKLFRLSYVVHIILHLFFSVHFKLSLAINHPGRPCSHKYSRFLAACFHTSLKYNHTCVFKIC